LIDVTVLLGVLDGTFSPPRRSHLNSPHVSRCGTFSLESGRHPTLRSDHFIGGLTIRLPATVKSRSPAPTGGNSQLSRKPICSSSLTTVGLVWTRCGTSANAPMYPVGLRRWHTRGAASPASARAGSHRGLPACWTATRRPTHWGLAERLPRKVSPKAVKGIAGLDGHAEEQALITAARRCISLRRSNLSLYLVENVCVRHDIFHIQSAQGASSSTRPAHGKAARNRPFENRALRRLRISSAQPQDYGCIITFTGLSRSIPPYAPSRRGLAAAILFGASSKRYWRPSVISLQSYYGAAPSGLPLDASTIATVVRRSVVASAIKMPRSSATLDRGHWSCPIAYRPTVRSVALPNRGPCRMSRKKKGCGPTAANHFTCKQEAGCWDARSVK